MVWPPSLNGDNGFSSLENEGPKSLFLTQNRPILVGRPLLCDQHPHLANNHMDWQSACCLPACCLLRLLACLQQIDGEEGTEMCCRWVGVAITAERVCRLVLLGEHTCLPFEEQFVHLWIGGLVAHLLGCFGGDPKTPQNDQQFAAHDGLHDIAYIIHHAWQRWGWENRGLVAFGSFPKLNPAGSNAWPNG